MFVIELGNFYTFTCWFAYPYLCLACTLCMGWAGAPVKCIDCMVGEMSLMCGQVCERQLDIKVCLAPLFNFRSGHTRSVEVSSAELN